MLRLGSLQVGPFPAGGIGSPHNLILETFVFQDGSDRAGFLGLQQARSALRPGLRLA